MKSKVTTRHGDTGEAMALSGERLSKAHPIMQCTGSLDELRARVALVRLMAMEHGAKTPEDSEECVRVADFLLWLLHVFFVVGSQLSDPLNKRPGYRLTNLDEKHLARLEREQSRLEKEVELPKAFLVSATTPLAAHVDIACTVARRFERSVVALKEAVPEFEPSVILPFANRLSDYLFVLARSLEGGQHHAVDYGVLDA